MFEWSSPHMPGCIAVQRDDDRDVDRGGDRRDAIERSELAAFFREKGLGWEIDAEGLVDRLAGERGTR